MTWGTDLWGTGFAPNFSIPTNASPVQIEDSPIVNDANYGFYIASFKGDSVTFLQNAVGEFLSDGSLKYLYVLPGGATNDENAFTPTYTIEPAVSDVWTLSINSSSTWVPS